MAMRLELRLHDEDGESVPRMGSSETVVAVFVYYCFDCCIQDWRKMLMQESKPMFTRVQTRVPATMTRNRQEHGRDHGRCIDSECMLMKSWRRDESKTQSRRIISHES